MPLVKVKNDGMLYVNDLNMTYLTASTLSVGTGQARNSTNLNDIVVETAITISTAVQGAGGLDQGTVAADTKYAVFVFGDSTLNNAATAVLSLSATEPLPPVGYDMFRRVGYILTDGSSNVLPFDQTGRNSDKHMMYRTLIQELNAGAATTFTDVDLVSSVPAMATDVYLVASITPNSAGNQVKLRKNGSASTAGNVQLSGVVAAAAQVAPVTVQCDASAVIEYLVSNGSDAATLWVAGYLDSL